MIESFHTVQCQIGTYTRNKLIEEYKSLYPKYCKTCTGTGIIVSTFDPSPPGISLGSGCYTDENPCEDCVERGICPQCGEKRLNGMRNKCEGCGAVVGGPGCPPWFECDCWEDQNARFSGDCCH